MDDESLCSSGGCSAGITAGANNLPQETSPDQLVLIRIHVPELNVEKCLQFHKEELIWEVKQQCLAALPKVSSPDEGGLCVITFDRIIKILVITTVLYI